MAIEVLQNDDQDCDCIFSHFLTNYIRTYSQEECVELCDEFIKKGTYHCQFANIELKKNILKCVIPYNIISNVVLQCQFFKILAYVVEGRQSGII